MFAIKRSWLEKLVGKAESGKGLLARGRMKPLVLRVRRIGREDQMRTGNKSIETTYDKIIHMQNWNFDYRTSIISGEREIVPVRGKTAVTLSVRANYYEQYLSRATGTGRYLWHPSHEQFSNIVRCPVLMSHDGIAMRAATWHSCITPPIYIRHYIIPVSYLRRLIPLLTAANEVKQQKWAQKKRHTCCMLYSIRVLMGANTKISVQKG